jgi:dihydrofolate synthase / folylpolyglutamate synthase
MTTLIDQLLAMPGRGVKTFEAFQRLDQILGSPHRAFRSVHVGGTNGKGSVATKIAAGLRAEGFRVGLYTSPHISNVRERIQINGEMIPEEAFLRHLSHIFRIAAEAYSFFDFLTALAFLYFREEKIDWAVIEVGLGGRLDATNVIQPELAVITSIGYDHMEILGDTLEKIAQEKFAIAKPGIPFIAGPSAAHFFPNAQAVPPVPGFYDAENSEIAAAALRQLSVSEKSIEAGISKRPECRFEILGNTVLDGAHNTDGFHRLIEALKIHFPNEKFHFIVAFSKDKEWQACLDLIRPYAKKISFINSQLFRSASLGGGSMQETLGTVDAREVICGSFYIMKEARFFLKSKADSPSVSCSAIDGAALPTYSTEEMQPTPGSHPLPFFPPHVQDSR